MVNDPNSKGEPQESSDMTFIPAGVAKVDERGRMYLPATARLNLFDAYGIPLEERQVQILVRPGLVLLQAVIPQGSGTR